MLATKDVLGDLGPLAPHVASLIGVAVPDTEATLPAEATAGAAHAVGIDAQSAPDPATALAMLSPGPGDRVLICGSLYLAGFVLRENG
jgi:dihydrofolate synthase/folylpolyglutamate synthase